MADQVEISSPPMNSAVLSMQSILQQNQDIRGGKKMILANKLNYITKLEAQDDPQYKAMAEMAPIYILYPKVVDGFVGTIFAKDPHMTGIEFTDAQKEQNKNIDLLGNSIDKFAENVVSEIMENGFCASMNDYSDKLSRPFIRLIKPHQFISFRTNSDDGYPKFTQFIFVESIEIDDPENEFDSIEVNQYTVLDFAQNPNNKNEKNYRVRIYQALTKNENKTDSEKIILKSEKFPKKDGKFFDSIPIVINGVESNNFTIDKSLLQDISDMNISVIQRTVDQVYMLHWTALPTPYITGMDGKGQNDPDTIGPTKIWYITETDANVGMLEFTGSSARAHQDFIDNLLYLMAVMGAQILKKEGVSRETATSVLVRTAQQTSIVATMVNNASMQLQTTLGIQFEWSKIKVGTDFSYNLNDDFVKVDMEPNAQIALVKSWLDGAISHKTVFTKMKEGEIIDPNKTFEEELEDINKNQPPYFEKELEAKNAKEAAELAFKNGGQGGGNKDDTKGSNLENGNTNNPLATEQV
jgi:hypothetical protein